MVWVSLLLTEGELHCQFITPSKLFVDNEHKFALTLLCHHLHLPQQHFLTPKIGKFLPVHITNIHTNMHLKSNLQLYLYAYVGKEEHHVIHSVYANIAACTCHTHSS